MTVLCRLHKYIIKIASAVFFILDTKIDHYRVIVVRN
nr:MAG TPA: hypothetical protein [Caudoviricetes sp.]